MMRRRSMSCLLLAPLLTIAQADAAGALLDFELRRFSLDAGPTTLLAANFGVLQPAGALVSLEHRFIVDSDLFEAGHIVLMPPEGAFLGDAASRSASGSAFLITSPLHSSGSGVGGSNIPLQTTADVDTGHGIVVGAPPAASSTVVPLPASAGLLGLALASLAALRKCRLAATSTASKFR